MYCLPYAWMKTCAVKSVIIYVPSTPDRYARIWVQGHKIHNEIRLLYHVGLAWANLSVACTMGL